MAKYRVKAPILYVGGCPFPQNGTFDFGGWPRWPVDEFEAVDDEAKKILSYYDQHRCNPWLLPTPVGNDGKPFLCAIYPDPRSRELLGIRPGTNTDGMPRYVVSATDVRGLRIGNTDHKVGDEVTYLGWPINGLLKPANDVAHLIAAYFEENAQHPDLGPCPWCLYRNGPYLPQLPARPLRRVDPAADCDYGHLRPPAPRSVVRHYNPLATR